MNHAQDTIERVSPADAAKLRFYVSCRGLGVFYASFGKVLEHQSLYGLNAKICKSCDGLGFTAKTLRCPRCQGSGLLPANRARRSSRRGIKGYLPHTELNVRAGIEQVVEIPDDKMAAIGEVHRRLSFVDSVDSACVNVLCARFDAEWQGLVDLWEFTPAGRTLAKRHPDWTAEQTFFALRAENELQKDQVLDALFKEADEQGRSFLKKASVLWNISEY